MNYNQFSRKSSWYDPDDYSPEHECEDCKSLHNTIHDASKNAREIVKQLYSPNIDISMLESFVDELCYALDIAVGQGEIQVQKKKEINFMSYWTEFNNESLLLVAK